MLNLTIQHLIHLTRDQRYALHAGIEIVVVGASVPVWYLDKVTSEPAREVFCKYYLKNDKQDIPIQVKPDGYEVSVPYREGKKIDISDGDWRELSLNNPEKLDLMYQQCVSEVSSKNLLDTEDGGGQHMSYREHNKMKLKDRSLKVMHFVQIWDMHKLTNSI